MLSTSDLPEPSAQPRMQDHVFISYASKDRAFVGRLSDALRALGYTVWIDFEGILGRGVWRQAVVDGVYASAVVMVALSPDALGSQWVDVELAVARKYDKKIIPLRVPPLDGVSSRRTATRCTASPMATRSFGCACRPPFFSF